MGSRIAKLNEEVSTGKRINRASDDPGRISQLHNVRQQLNNQGVYMKNASQAEQLLNVADTTLKEIHTTLTEARELAVQFANEVYNADQRGEAANVTDTLFERTISLSNTQFNERHIFAGTAYDDVAFDDTGTYQGSTDAPESVVGDDLKVKTGFDGSDLLTGSSDMFGAISNLKTALNADDTAAIVSALDDIDAALLDVEKGMVEVPNPPKAHGAEGKLLARVHQWPFMCTVHVQRAVGARSSLCL